MSTNKTFASLLVVMLAFAMASATPREAFLGGQRQLLQAAPFTFTTPSTPPSSIKPMIQVVVPGGGAGGNHPTPLCQSPNYLGTAETGDTLTKISQVLNVGLCALNALNPQINSPDLALLAGDKICIQKT